MKTEEEKAWTREYNRKWAANNPERVKKSQKRYYEKNKARILDKQRVWREAHKMVLLEYSKQHYKRNKTIRSVSLNAWYMKHQEQLVCRAQLRRVEQLFTGVVDVEVKELLVETKLLQLNIKKLLNRGETNEKRR